MQIMYRFFVSASLLYTKFQVNYNCSNLMYLKKKLTTVAFSNPTAMKLGFISNRPLPFLFGTEKGQLSLDYIFFGVCEMSTCEHSFYSIYKSKTKQTRQCYNYTLKLKICMFMKRSIPYMLHDYMRFINTMYIPQPTPENDKLQLSLHLNETHVKDSMNQTLCI